MAKILIVDDEASIRRSLRDILEFEKYEVDDAKDGIECLAKVKQATYDVVLCDIKMPVLDGIEVLERIQAIQPDLPIILISGHADLDTAVEVVRKGAFDFISKPPDMNRLLITIRNALEKSNLVTETKSLKQKIKHNRTPPMVGESAPILQVKDTIERVAPTEARVLILGPNGTGKELVAKWLHEKSTRNEKPFIEVNCAAIPSELIESVLFGHEKGAFTSALKQHIGKFEQADGGTIFLDEIGDMSLPAQAKVLRALQEGKISRVGGEKDIRVNVRVVAATNKDLRREIDAKRFREDLYHRLAVIIIQVPALNSRREDIGSLATHFVQLTCEEYGIPAKEITKNAIEVLKNLDWTGNIRELRNVIERLIILSGKSITDKDVMSFVAPTMGSSNPLHEIFSKFDDEKDFLAYILAEYKHYHKL